MNVGEQQLLWWSPLPVSSSEEEEGGPSETLRDPRGPSGTLRPCGPPSVVVLAVDVQLCLPLTTIRFLGNR